MHHLIEVPRPPQDAEVIVAYAIGIHRMLRNVRPGATRILGRHFVPRGRLRKSPHQVTELVRSN